MAEEANAPETRAADSPVAAPAADSAGAAVPVAEPSATSVPAKPDRGGFVWGTGRRKAAVARVRIKPGEGKYLVNGRAIEQFFKQSRDQQDVIAPLKLTKTEGSLDVFANVKGGGFTGQAGAVRLGLSRALKGYDPSLEPVLRDAEMLTRDPRRVERKKYGQPGARRRFQFSKR